MVLLSSLSLLTGCRDATARQRASSIRVSPGPVALGNRVRQEQEIFAGCVHIASPFTGVGPAAPENITTHGPLYRAPRILCDEQPTQSPTRHIRF
jgi:hypothetical protein